jgi:hypothetical protein
LKSRRLAGQGRAAKNARCTRAGHPVAPAANVLPAGPAAPHAGCRRHAPAFTPGSVRSGRHRRRPPAFGNGRAALPAQFCRCAQHGHPRPGAQRARFGCRGPVPEALAGMLRGSTSPAESHLANTNYCTQVFVNGGSLVGLAQPSGKVLDRWRELSTTLRWAAVSVSWLHCRVGGTWGPVQKGNAMRSCLSACSPTCICCCVSWQGLGIVWPMPLGKLEVNVCYALSSQPLDRPVPRAGLQFGITPPSW